MSMFSVVIYVFVLNGHGTIVTGDVPAPTCEEAIMLVTELAMEAGQMPALDEIKRAVPTCESFAI